MTNELIKKAIAQLEPVENDDSPNGSFDIILSAQTLDRDGDVLKSSEWKNLPEWIPMDVDHGMTVTATVGSGEPFIDDDGNLRVRGKFASTPLAQEVRTLVNEKHVRNVSVAFMNDKALQKDGKPFRELLNGGFVNTPSNRESVILDSKALDKRAAELAEERLESKSVDEPRKGVYIDILPRLDTEAFAKQIALGFKAAGSENALLQAIHDASAHLGALCQQLQQEEDAEESSEPDKSKSVDNYVIGTKSVVGSLEDLMCRVGCALQAIFPNDYPYPRATFLNDDGMSGTVVYRLGDDLWAATFVDDGADVEIDDDKARPVGLITTIVEDPDGEDEEKSADPNKMEAFKDALHALTSTDEKSAGTPEESPAESPEAAAASVKEPAPVSADDAAESDLAVEKKANRMLMALFASEL